MFSAFIGLTWTMSYRPKMMLSDFDTFNNNLFLMSQLWNQNLCLSWLNYLMPGSKTYKTNRYKFNIFYCFCTIFLYYISGKYRKPRTAQQNINRASQPNDWQGSEGHSSLILHISRSKQTHFYLCGFLSQWEKVSQWVESLSSAHLTPLLLFFVLVKLS